ncbi:cytochrome P450 [Reticulibacter mediterranei]|nr:cytochrome P450 [Reticulibacter mediterranei]
MQLPSFVRNFSLPPLAWHHAMRDWSKRMRQNQPIWYDSSLGGWRLFCYEDIVRVQNDYQTFSSEPSNGGSFSIIALDPPRHRQLRSLVTPAFSARTILQQTPRIQRIARELLETALARGAMDMVADFAVPFPILVIADLLGLPPDNWQRVKEWTDTLINQSSSEVAQRSGRNASSTLPLDEISRVLAQATQDHHQQPRESLLRLLLAAEVDGQRLTEQELLGFFLTLLVAGNITTTQLLGNAILCFDENPEAWEQLQRDRSLVASAVEEVLRYLPPNRGTGGSRTIIGGRRATTDVEICGQLIRRGEEVFVTTISANFDEHHFSDPDRFDIGRMPNHHLSFGHGIHFCLGAPLARLETKIALELLLDLLPNWRLLHNVPLEQIRNHIVFGAQRLPLVFST